MVIIVNILNSYLNSNCRVKLGILQNKLHNKIVQLINGYRMNSLEVVKSMMYLILY